MNDSYYMRVNDGIYTYYCHVTLHSDGTIQDDLLYSIDKYGSIYKETIGDAIYFEQSEWITAYHKDDELEIICNIEDDMFLECV